MKKEEMNSQKLIMLGQLSAVILHDLQSPVTFIDSNNRYLIKKIKKKLKATDLAEELIKVLKENEEGLDQIKELLDSIKSLVKNEYKPKVLALNNLIISCNKIVIPQARNKIKIMLNLPQQSPLARVNPSQIKQVLINIMVNAIEAFEKDSDSPEISVTCLEKDKYAIIEITDNGCGIEQDRLESVFEWYATSKLQGSGQGLAISKQIIEDHNGQISCKSEIGISTTFTISLPLELGNE